jgi:hypothetical protein
VQIDVDTPYSSGGMNIPRFGYGQIFNYLQFSNGVVIGTYSQSTSSLYSANLFYGLAVDSSKEVIAGLKYTPSAYWQKCTADVVISLYINNDTAWSQTGIFPETIVPLDSLFDLPYNSPKIGKGKWVYNCGRIGEVQPVSSWANSAKNYNSILYFHTKRNKMILQVSKIWTSWQPPSPMFGVMLVDSLHLQWSVDSLGNGKFRPASAVKQEKNIGMRNVLNTRSLLIRTDYPDQRVFNLAGRAVSSGNKIQPKGVLVGLSGTEKDKRTVQVRTGR